MRLTVPEGSRPTTQPQELRVRVVTAFGARRFASAQAVRMKARQRR